MAGVDDRATRRRDEAAEAGAGPSRASAPHAASRSPTARGDAGGHLLAVLGDRLRPLDDARAITAAAAEALGTALGAARVGYAEVERDGRAAVYREWNPAGLPTLVGRHRLDLYGAARAAAIGAGRTDAVADVAADPRLGPGEVAAFRRAGIGAAIVVPLVKAGVLSALLFVHAAGPRAWTAAEVGAAEEVAERTWAAVGRARAEAALRESEERLRLALEAAGNVGTWDYDLRTGRILGDAGFAALYGLDPGRAAAGVTLDEVAARLHPEDRERVLAGLGRLLARRSGGATSSEYRVMGRDGTPRWVSARARRHDDAAGRAVRLPGIALDVTERRRAEERAGLLLALGDRLRDLDDPDDVSFAAAELLGRAFGVSRAGYGTVDPVAETITITRDWNAPGIRSLAGTLRFRDHGSYIEDLKRGETAIVADARTDPRTAATAGVLEAISARAFVNMPVSERGGLVALLYLNHGDARRWTAEDLSLIREVAERTRTAVERRRAEAARREGDARFRTLFDSLDAGFCVVEVRSPRDGRPADYRVIEANPAFARHTGLSDVLGRWMREAVPTLEEHWFEIYAHVAETGEPVRFEQGANVLDGRWFDVHAFRLGDPAARQVAIFFSDISDRRRAETRLVASEARYRALVETSTTIVWSMDGEGRITEENPSWAAFTGQAFEAYRGRGWLEAIHPEDREAVTDAWRVAQGALAPYECAYRLRRHDGAWRWTVARGTPVLDAGGRLREWIGANTDETERRAAEERQSLLMREVDHRAKNALAVVQATLRLTRADDLPSFVRAIEGRVGALARAQTLLADDRWAGADLRALLVGELAPFLSGDAARVQLAGARVALPAGAAQPLAMAVHELATNALKYGALSWPSGRVAIGWRVAPDAEETLRLEWTETDGPPVAAAPTRRGFGTRVLDGTVASQLGGTVVQDWRPGGLACTITVPLARARAVAAER